MFKIRGPKSSSETPVRLIIIVFVCIAFIHALSEVLVLYFLPHLSRRTHNIFETVFMISVLCPTLYLFLFRPMVLNINKRKLAEEALHKAHDELELRVRQRTAELERAQEQLRNLNAHLQSVREDERANFAREIHEELGQALSAVKMKLSLITKTPLRNDEDEKNMERLKTVMDMVDGTIQRISRICAELRPSLLDYPGLGAAIEWEAEEFRKRSGIECETNLSLGNITENEGLAISLFRIVQEALTNVLRHAKATKVKTTLMERDDNVELEITDNGIGITDEQLFKAGSFGLLGMRETVHTRGGALTISGIQNKGTTVKVSIPIKPERLQ